MSYEAVKACVARRVEWMRLQKDRPCERCGTQLDPDEMHFHHREPAEKEFGIASAAFRVSRVRLAAEIAKCELLCADCHISEHHPIPREHGDYASYVAGCRCSACKEANRLYHVGYRRRRAAKVL